MDFSQWVRFIRSYSLTNFQIPAPTGLTIFVKSSIVDVRQGSECASDHDVNK